MYKYLTKWYIIFMYHIVIEIMCSFVLVYMWFSDFLTPTPIVYV